MFHERWNKLLLISKILIVATGMTSSDVDRRSFHDQSVSDLYWVVTGLTGVLLFC
jgi:hypothetical protein